MMNILRAHSQMAIGTIAKRKTEMQRAGVEENRQKRQMYCTRSVAYCDLLHSLSPFECNFCFVTRYLLMSPNPHICFACIFSFMLLTQIYVILFFIIVIIRQIICSLIISLLGIIK